MSENLIYGGKLANIGDFEISKSKKTLKFWSDDMPGGCRGERKKINDGGDFLFVIFKDSIGQKVMYEL